ncbi:hypothetical protein ACH5RR_005298 [Cinchona calisaya]|uniref:Mitochondrial glycoprotein n=1 Tax=Cinchona calisaya TaxID=153742 RepID=A0ABD3AKT2_9GENT
MALSSMVSKASPSSLVPLALRAISSAGSLHGSIVTAAVTVNRERVLHNGGVMSGSFVQSHQFSTAIQAKKLLDTSLLKVLRSEIITAKKYDFAKQELPKTPTGFPFNIKDNPGESMITLIRDFPDEIVEVKVRKAPEEMVVDEDDSDDDSSSSDSDDDNEDPSEEKDSSKKSCKNRDSSDDEDDCDGCSDDNDYISGEDTQNSVSEEKKEPPCLPMRVTVCKKDGRRLKFELGATADEIKIKQMSIEEYSGSGSDTKVEFSGPEFEKLEHNLQHSLLKYLEIRGIKVSLVVFLHKYMAAKSSKDDMLWLNKLKNFIKK